MTHDIRANLTDLLDGIGSGRLLEAFDRHYHDDVVMKENDEHDPKRVGKAANRAIEEMVVANSEWHGAKVGAILVDGDESAYEMWMDATMFGTRIVRTQVARQTWKDGKIIAEVFYYKP